MFCMSSSVVRVSSWVGRMMELKVSVNSANFLELFCRGMLTLFSNGIPSHLVLLSSNSCLRLSASGDSWFGCASVIGFVLCSCSLSTNWLSSLLSVLKIGWVTSVSFCSSCICASRVLLLSSFSPSLLSILWRMLLIVPGSKRFLLMIAARLSAMFCSVTWFR
uniref:Uncharacterized protein n=1 Tax=Cacopsylla melanoneura TaxID=428564 RepID=A0A8D8Z9Y3_9HEMI